MNGLGSRFKRSWRRKRIELPGGKSVGRWGFRTSNAPVSRQFDERWTRPNGQRIPGSILQVASNANGVFHECRARLRLHFVSQTNGSLTITMPVAFDETVQTEAPTKRRGFMSRLRLGRNNKQQQALADKRESTPSPAMDKPVREEVREGPLPVSALRKKKSSKKNKGPKIPQRELFLLERPPTAKEAAFGGPPRYDWIDIVSVSELNAAGTTGKGVSWSRCRAWRQLVGTPSDMLGMPSTGLKIWITYDSQSFALNNDVQRRLPLLRNFSLTTSTGNRRRDQGPGGLPPQQGHDGSRKTGTLDGCNP